MGGVRVRVRVRVRVKRPAVACVGEFSVCCVHDCTASVCCVYDCNASVCCVRGAASADLRGKAIAGVVGHVHGFVVGVERVHRHHRSENLFLRATAVPGSSGEGGGDIYR